MESVNQSRRGFLKFGTSALVGAAVLLTIKPSKAFAAGDQVTSEIGDNHGHDFAIALNELVANGKTTYNIQGASKHPHTIVMTEDMIAALQAGNNVEIESSEDKGHTHTVLLQLL